MSVCEWFLFSVCYMWRYLEAESWHLDFFLVRLKRFSTHPRSFNRTQTKSSCHFTRSCFTFGVWWFIMWNIITSVLQCCVLWLNNQNSSSVFKNSLGSFVPEESTVLDCAVPFLMCFFIHCLLRVKISGSWVLANGFFLVKWNVLQLIQVASSK